MAENAPTTRDRILISAYRLIYRQGFARVSVDAIADGAGVTKRTVYYHFESKDEIAAEMLRVQHAHLMRQFDHWVHPASESPAGLVAELFTALTAWAEAPDWLGSGFTRLSAELSDMRGHPARRAASEHKKAVEHWLQSEFHRRGIDAPAKLAARVMTLVEGGISLALIHGDTTYIRTARDAALDLLPETPADGERSEPEARQIRDSIRRERTGLDWGDSG